MGMPASIFIYNNQVIESDQRPIKKWGEEMVPK